MRCHLLARFVEAFIEVFPGYILSLMCQLHMVYMIIIMVMIYDNNNDTDDDNNNNDDDNDKALW